MHAEMQSAIPLTQYSSVKKESYREAILHFKEVQVIF